MSIRIMALLDATLLRSIPSYTIFKLDTMTTKDVQRTPNRQVNFSVTDPVDSVQIF